MSRPPVTRFIAFRQDAHVGDFRVPNLDDVQDHYVKQVVEILRAYKSRQGVPSAYKEGRYIPLHAYAEALRQAYIILDGTDAPIPVSPH